MGAAFGSGRGAEGVLVLGGAFMDLSAETCSGSPPARLEAQVRSLKERQEPQNLAGHHRHTPRIHAQGCNHGPKRKLCESRLGGPGSHSTSGTLDVVPGRISWPKRADKGLPGLTGGGQ